MAITYTISSATTLFSAGAAATTTVTPSLTLVVDSIITVICLADDNASAGTLSISNSGTALTWTSIAVTNVNNNCKVAAWWAKSPDTTARTVTVTKASANASNRRVHAIVHNGAHTTDPVPTGKVFSGPGGQTSVSQSITPTATGSALWLGSGDWGATDSYVPATNCTLQDTAQEANQQTAALIRPTTQPLANAAAFTIGETVSNTTTGKIIWVAFEVQASSVPADLYEVSNLRAHPKYVMRGRPA